ncbi:MAG: hypothetical protein LBH51_05400 [Treponema sp.]|jgi:hypothetical protein|nr:hypothetical protein [Treponema sp.]
MKTRNFTGGADKYSPGPGIFGNFAALPALLFCAGVFFSSCLNPIGFVPDLLSDAGEVINPGLNDPANPGDISSADKPDIHPDPDKGAIVFKNLTGGSMARIVTYTITGQEHSDIKADVSLSAGQEKSMILLPGHYDITMKFDDAAAPIAGTKALLRGRVEYVYFYAGKDGAYKGGVNMDSSHVYGDINYNYYQDNENLDDNKDGDAVNNPREGDVSADNDPRIKLPPTMRENYGILIVHNLSKTMPLLKLVFDHYENDNAAGNTFDMHWEMNPGPDKGNRKSIILHPGVWRVRAVWIDPARPDDSGAVIDTSIVKAGVSNYINHLYFYKAAPPDGAYHLTDESDNTRWIPQPDANDYLDNGNTGGVDMSSEGQITNENENINTSGPSWDMHRNNYGVLTVQNLSSRVRITRITLTHDLDKSRKWEMGSVGIQNNRSIILEKGVWDVVIDYSWGSQTGSKTLDDLNVKPVGLTNIRTSVYFSFFDDGDNSWEIDADYRVEGGINAPPVYQYDGNSPNSGGDGGNEGDSPGALTDANKGSLGLVVMKNLSKTADINAVNFSSAAPAKNYSISGVSRSNQMSILLGAGGWSHYLEYYADNRGSGRIPAGSGANSFTLTAGSIYVLYFYQNNTGDYSISSSWPPVWPDLPPLTDANTIPVGSNEGYLHIKNGSSATILTKLSYQYNGADTEMNFPGNIQLVPGAETANDAILPVGAATARFYNGVKQQWSGAIPVNIKAGQIFSVTFTDGMDITDLPDGYGMVRVTNKSSEAVQSAVFYDSRMTARRESFTLVSGETDSLRVPFQSYVAQFKMESFTAEFIITLDNSSKRIVAVTITDETITDKSNVANPNTQEGGIRVFNAYPMNVGAAAYLDTKIFKYHLYKAQIDQTTGNHYYGANPDYSFDGTTPYSPIGRGQNKNIPVVAPGFYKLIVVAGSYPWPNYQNSIAIDNLTLSEKLISYDCGEVLIVAGQERQYHFNNHGNEKDTPNGYVTFNITMSEHDNAFAMVYFEMAVRPRDHLSDAEFNQIYNAPWTSASPGPDTRWYNKWPGPWINASQGPYAPKETLVFEWGGLLNSYTNQAGPFAVPPGIYWTRYNDNYLSGYARGGGNDTHWRLIDLRKYARRHVNCASDHTVGTNWAPVPQS